MFSATNLRQPHNAGLVRCDKDLAGPLSVHPLSTQSGRLHIERNLAPPGDKGSRGNPLWTEVKKKERVAARGSFLPGVRLAINSLRSRRLTQMEPNPSEVRGSE